jgi:hypothetical protein
VSIWTENIARARSAFLALLWGTMRRRSFLLVFLPLLASGCGQQPAGAPSGSASHASSAPSPDATPSMDQERLERLRSLGYLDTTGLAKLGAGAGAQVFDAKLVSPGYTLVVFAGTCTCQLLSLSGEVVRSWKDEPCHRWEHAELLPEGDLVVVGARLDQDKVADPIQSGRYVMRLSWDGRVLWRLEINAHHDLSVMPDGKLLTLVLRRRRIPAIDPDNDVADDLVTMLSADGKVVESASLYDVLSSSKIPFRFQMAGGGGKEGHRLVDLFHTNTVRPASVPELAGRSPIYGKNTLLLTSRHQDELMVIDWPNRQLLWHWGRGVLSGPHEASLLENGNILVFDNGLSRGWSRVLELNPLAPAKLVQFAPGSSGFFSRVMGSCQRLPNGNTLIVDSEGGAAFELTPRGAPAWSYEGTLQTPEGRRDKIIRMRRIPTATVDEIISRHRK